MISIGSARDQDIVIGRLWEMGPDGDLNTGIKPFPQVGELSRFRRVVQMDVQGTSHGDISPTGNVGFYQATIIP
jgi:hypothetical protein